MSICSERIRNFWSLSAGIDLSVPVKLKYGKGNDETCSGGRHLELKVLSAEHTVVLQRWNRCSPVLRPLLRQLFSQRASPAGKLQPYD